MRILIGTIVLLIYSGVVIYVGLNVKSLLHSYNINPRPILFWFIFFLVAFGFVLGRLHPVLSFLSLIGNYWMFILEYGLLLCIVANLLVKFTPLTTKFVGTGALSILVVLFAIGTYFAFTPVVREHTITIDKAGEPMRVVMASDFHLGFLSGKRHLERFVTLANDQNPDLVLLVGDIVDDEPTRYIKTEMKEIMSKINSTYGVYGVLGNHEYYGNKINEFKQAMEDSNVNILMDETIELSNGVFLTGREDLTNKNRLSLHEMKPSNVEAPWLVMNHTPNDLTEPMEEGVDLHVSGHTHKGQFWPNQLITKRIFDLDYGHDKWRQMHAFVSSGFGFWGPAIRIGSQSELWLINIEFTK